jgi:hypothetical protein
MLLLPWTQGSQWDWPKQLIMTFVVVFGVVPVVHWHVYADPRILPDTLTPVICMLGGYGIGFVFFVLRFPECAFPGELTSILSSHAIWHIAVAFAAWSWLEGIEGIFRSVIPKAKCLENTLTLTDAANGTSDGLFFGPRLYVSVPSDFLHSPQHIDAYGIIVANARSLVTLVLHALDWIPTPLQSPVTCEIDL